MLTTPLPHPSHHTSRPGPEGPPCLCLLPSSCTPREDRPPVTCPLSPMCHALGSLSQGRPRPDGWRHLLALVPTADTSGDQDPKPRMLPMLPPPPALVPVSAAFSTSVLAPRPTMELPATPPAPTSLGTRAPLPPEASRRVWGPSVDGTRGYSPNVRPSPNQRRGRVPQSSNLY